MLALCLLSPLLAGQTIASESEGFSLLKRDDSSKDAFIPGVTPGCPKDWPLCGSSGVCYNPDEGQTCCPGGTYACPSSSFCLTDGYCCPNDLSPDACAQKYGLTLVPTSSVPEQTEFPSSDSVGGASDAFADSESDSATSDPLYPRPTVPLTSASSVTITSTPIPTSAVAPWPSLSVSVATGSPSVQEEPAYTGGCEKMGSGSKWSGIVAAAIGVLGLI